MLKENDTITTAGGKDLAKIQKMLSKRGFKYVTEGNVITITGVPNEESK